MGCGCKKGQETTQPQQPAQTQQQQNETVKQAVTKIVEKYYKKNK